MRYYSKQLDSIKAQAIAKLGRRLTDMENARGFTLQDSRPTIDRARAMGRKAVPAAPESWADRERAKLAREKRESKLQKMPRNERLLAMMDEMAERETTPDGEHARLESVLLIRDRIRFDPTREAADLEFANLVLEQHGAGMDSAVADQLFDELVVQEQQHIAGLRTAKLEQQQRLLGELASLDTEAASLPSDANRFNLLRAMVQRGLPMPPEDHAAFDAAEADPAAQAVLVARYHGSIEAYAAEVGA